MRSLVRLKIPVRDGANMGADVALPDGEGPFPAIVMRTPYGRHRAFGPPWIWLRDSGYAIVGVDARGRGESTGEFRPIESDAEDGYDVVEWVAAQPWCTGKVGMMGGSHDGLLQWYSARLKPPSLKCIVPVACSIVYGGDRPFPFMNGIIQPYFMWWCHFIAGPTIQNFMAPSWTDAMNTPPLRDLDKRVGRERSLMRHYLDGRMTYTSRAATFTPEEIEELDIPAFIVVGWWDDQITTLRTWRAMQTSKGAADCRLLVGAWDHGGNAYPRPLLGGYDVSRGLDNVMARMKRFYDQWLKDEPNDEPRIRVLRTGTFDWEEPEEWPPPAVPRSLFLHDGGRLAFDEPAGTKHEFVFDPEHPVRAAAPLATFIFSDPPLDTRYLERRSDVLTYTTDAFTEPLDVSGEVVLRVYVSSDRPDTDVVAWVTDVHPDGRSIICGMQQGMRARYRAPSGLEQLLKPDEIAELEFTLCNLHHTFRPGHRLRLVVTSSHHPWFGLNYGGAENPADQVVPHVARNAIHHSEAAPSQLLLQVTS